MDAPVTGAVRLAEARSEPNLIKTDLKRSNSVDDNLVIAQLAKTSHTRPHFPSAPSRVKRRKSKPVRFEISGNDVQNKYSLPNNIIVASDPPSLCLQEEKSLTKGFKTPVPNSPAMIRAEEIQSSLGIEFPSCIKKMVKSQVACGFWMGLPLLFCRLFLPKDDTTFVLEDENRKQWEVKYIAYKNGLSAGWKTFAVHHNLNEGDVLVFHLLESAKFKVYILRANNSNEVDGALRLSNVAAHSEQPTPVTPSPKPKRRKRPESLSLTAIQKKRKKSNPIEHSGNNSEEVGSEVLEASRSYKTNLSFQEVKAFEDFRIVVKGVCIDRELPEDVRTGYYKLCVDKKQFLHDGLREGVYYKLVAGMIGETVSIANEIKNCKLTTTKEEFDVWDNSLKSFELLGMKVGFLRDRIHMLGQLAVESEGAMDVKRYVESKNKQKRIDDEMKKVAAKLLKLKETAKKFEGVSSSLKKKVEKYEHKFQIEVDAPW